METWEMEVDREKSGRVPGGAGEKKGVWMVVSGGGRRWRGRVGIWGRKGVSEKGNGVVEWNGLENCG